MQYKCCRKRGCTSASPIPQALMEAATAAMPRMMVALVVAILMMAASSQATTPPACSSFAQRTCPNPPTVQGFDLSAYVGKWYEIGSTARFKLGTEQGLVCITANYTLAEAPTSTEGANVTVVNAGVQVLGPIAGVGISQIENAIGSACGAGREICQRSAPAGPLAQVIEQLKQVGETLTGQEAQTLSVILTDLSGAIESIRAQTTALASKVKAIAKKAGDVSQAVGSKAAQLKELEVLVKRAESQTLDLKPIDSAVPKIISVASSLLAKSGSNSGTAFFLSTLASQLVVEKEAILLNRFNYSLSLTTVLEAVTYLIKVDDSRPLQPFALTGFAEQSASDPAKLSVFFPMPGVPLTSGPYWVVAISGQASKGYEAALVFSCTQLDNDIDTGIFILSRTPTLRSRVVNRFLRVVKDYGFRFGCDNQFLFTVQDPSICKTTL